MQPISAAAGDPQDGPSSSDVADAPNELAERVLESLAEQTLAEIQRLQDDVRPVSSFTSFALLDSILARRLAALSATLDQAQPEQAPAAPEPQHALREELDRLMLQRVVSEFSFHEALTSVLLRRAGRAGQEEARLSVSAMAGRFDAAAAAAAAAQPAAPERRPELSSLLSHHLVSQALANEHFRSRLEMVMSQREARRPRLAPVQERAAVATAEYSNLASEWRQEWKQESTRLQAEVVELRRLLQACFEVSLDTQRAIRQEVAACLSRSQSADAAGAPSALEPRPAAPPGQCTVCLERPADTAFYKCGHQCACYLCARAIMDEGKPCVICRAPIADLLRVFTP